MKESTQAPIKKSMEVSMKKSILLILVLLAAIVCRAQIRMMVMSDPHVLEHSLMDMPLSESFLKAMQADLKAVEYSQSLFEQFCTKVKAEKPDLLLIPGDLSKDGERVTHEYMAKQLKAVEAAGTKVYIIPGNHDMENPLAMSYHGNKAAKVESVTEKEFMDIYADFGYSEAVSKDSLSNSYMVYPMPGLAIICVNSNTPNRFKNRYVHGRIYSGTLNWIEQAANMAHGEKRRIIAMVHHEVMAHHNLEEVMAPTAMTNMEKIKGLPSLSSVQNTFTRAGIKVVLTGHYHIQSINDINTLHGKLTDISTGSLSGFASPYRRMTLGADGKLRITSANMFNVKTDKWPATSIAKLEQQRLQYMIQLYLPKIIGTKQDFKVARQYLGDTFGTVLCALALGDETHFSSKQVIKNGLIAYDRYVKALTGYKATAVQSLKQEKDGPYRKIVDLMSSIMYNYVGKDRKHVIPDNNYTIQL